MREHVRQQNDLIVKLLQDIHQLQLVELESQQEGSVACGDNDVALRVTICVHFFPVCLVAGVGHHGLCQQMKHTALTFYWL